MLCNVWVVSPTLGDFGRQLYNIIVAKCQEKENSIMIHEGQADPHDQKRRKSRKCSWTKSRIHHTHLQDVGQ